MDIFEWIQQTLAPEACTSASLIYEHMASQSGSSLPIIYQPFDPNAKGHWRDRGAALDFVLSTHSINGRVLDFGPGDGWPALIIAPKVAEVVGVEGSQRRVGVCRANAARLDVTNVSFHYVEPGAPLPFEDSSFDAVVAASSVEQTPDPRATLAEFHRVLRPGGRLRLRYEVLARYRGGEERDLWLMTVTDDRTRLILYDRHVDEGYVVQVGITFALPVSRLIRELGGEDDALAFEDLTIERLTALRDTVTDVGLCTTAHPSGCILAAWLTEIGFRQVFPTHDGIYVAGELYEQLPVAGRPSSLAAIDTYLRPIVAVASDLPAPLTNDPAITAVK